MHIHLIFNNIVRVHMPKHNESQYCYGFCWSTDALFVHLYTSQNLLKLVPFM